MLLFVDCKAALLVCSNVLFPRTWRSPRDCHREKVSSPSAGSTPSCYGRYRALSVWSAAWRGFILIPWCKICAGSSRKVLLLCFPGFVEQCVKPAHVFLHLLRGAREPWGTRSPGMQSPFNLKGQKENLKVDLLPRELEMVSWIDVQQPQTEF